MSEPIFQHIYLKDEQSYNILNVDRPYFVVPWHLHPEIEIMSIIKGEGNRFVGDSVENFEPGDLVIVGSNLPHVWKSGSRHHEPGSAYRAKAHVILFKTENFGQGFFDISELRKIREMFARAGRGICFSGKTSSLASKKIADAYAVQGVKRFILFMDVLNDLAESDEYRLLASIGYKSTLFDHDMQRLNRVFDYLMLNFDRPLRLDEIAAEAYMSPTAFCRYFKTHTNKTVISFLNDLRIGHAKKMLIENKRNISEIHFSCGFNNASNFYEQFRKTVGCSPLQFRKQHEDKTMEILE